MRALCLKLFVIAVLCRIATTTPYATTFVCPGSTTDRCQNTATCDGAAFRRTAACKLQCMNEVGPNQYQDGASCDCGPVVSGGGGGGGCDDGGICCEYPEACQEA